MEHRAIDILAMQFVLPAVSAMSTVLIVGVLQNEIALITGHFRANSSNEGGVDEKDDVRFDCRQPWLFP